MQTATLQSSSADAVAQRTAARTKYNTTTKRSGITRLATPSFLPPAPTAKTPASSIAPTTATQRESPPRTKVMSSSIQPAAQTNSTAHEQSEMSSSAGGPSGALVTLNVSPSTSTGRPISWNHRVAAVCQRLEQSMQETELILMREASSAHSTDNQHNPTSGLENKHNPLTDACVPTPAQTLAAVQRYRSGCMSVLLELHAILEEAAPRDGIKDRSDAGETHSIDAKTASDCSPANGKEAVGVPPVLSTSGATPTPATSPSHSDELKELQQRYHQLEARLSKTLKTQTAYMAEVAAQQRHRERVGIFGEYMWTTRLLVEQEAAERAHLMQLRDYTLSHVAATQPPKSVGINAEGLKGVRATVASAPDVATTVPPPRPRQPSPDKSTAAVARLTAERDALLAELNQQTSRTQSLLSGQRRDVQAANERALAQMAARHDAEKAVWEARLAEATRTTAALQEACAGAQDELQRLRARQQEAQQYAALTQDGLQGQVKDTTKRMWQLQLANDHLDAKVRVLQRELEEVRLDRSPLRERPAPPVPPSSGEEEAGKKVASTGAEERVAAVPALIGVPAAARMARASTVNTTGTSATTPRSARTSASLRSIPRLPDPPLLQRTAVSDIRYGEPLHVLDELSHHQRRNSDAGGRSSHGPLTRHPNARDVSTDEDGEASVNPSVWLAYEERSLLASTTPTKHEHHCSDNCGRAEYPRPTASVTYAWGEARHPAVPSALTSTPSSRNNSSSTTRRTSAVPSFPVSTFSSARRASPAAGAVMPPPPAVTFATHTPARGGKQNDLSLADTPDTAAANGARGSANASYMSEGPTVYVSAETRSRLSATATTRTSTTMMTPADRYGDCPGEDSYLAQQQRQQRQPPPQQREAPVLLRRQLSLDRTPAADPPHPASVATTRDSRADREAEETALEDDDDGDQPILTYTDVDDNDVEEEGAEAGLGEPEVEVPPSPPPPPPLPRSSRSPPIATLVPSTPPSSRTHVISEGDEEDAEDGAWPPMTAPHGAAATSRSSPVTLTSKGSEIDTDDDEVQERHTTSPSPHRSNGAMRVREAEAENARAAAAVPDAEDQEEDSTAALPPSARARLENVRSEIVRHTEMLEREVQAVTARHDAAQRQRRRERDRIRVNAASLHASPTAHAATQREAAGHAEDGEADDGSTSDVDRALERLHIAQQEDDDQLAQYYAEVNRKRVELERCLRVVEERLSARHCDPAAQ